MLDSIKEYIAAVFKARILPVAIIFILLFAVLVNRMFQIQISEKEKFGNQKSKNSEETREIKATRGKIYDCNGKLLAYNKLSYNVTYLANSTTSKLTTDEKNKIIYHLLQILKKNNDKLSVEFYIAYDKNGVPQFTIKGKALLRFKAEVFSVALKKLTQKQQNMTAQEIYDFLRYNQSPKSPKFNIGKEYDDETALQIMAIRYNMYINRFKSYQSIPLSNNVDDRTVAAIKENSAELPGIDIEEDTTRVYKKSKYFAHLLGYTGTVTSDRLDKLKEEDPNTDYTVTDQIGVSGVESSFENYLRGKKGSEKISLNESTSQIDEVKSRKNPIAGNDVYLTINSDLQEECYKLLEEHIAGILIANINNSDSAGSKGVSASKIKVPIYDVYSALFENNIINANRFTEKNASALEKRTYQKFQIESQKMKKKMRAILGVNSKKTTKQLSDDMAEFINYFYKVLKNENLILIDKVEASDATFKKYTSHKISLSQFLQYAISKGWVDLKVLKIGNQYLSTQEIYQKLINYGMGLLDEDKEYKKMIYSYLVHQKKISGRDCCLLLFDQGDIKYNAKDYQNLKAGVTSAYTFLIRKIKSLEITPGSLGLEPCSGSMVITDVNTGVVRALVSYPSYDNNKMANQVDSEYFYDYLTQAKASPLLNRPVQQKLAPGSTFKVISSVAGLEEGVITPSTNIYDHVKFTQISPSPSCWHKAGHGNLHVATALEASCNYFFYTVGYRLGNGHGNNVNAKKGLARLKKYADMFGITEKSGIELEETKPNFASKDIVRAAIGQDNHAYALAQISRYVTTVANNGTCYNLTLLDKVKNVDGKTILKNKAKVRNKVSISNSTWNAIHHGMYLVANGPQSSIKSMLSKIKTKVAGKTGTAQINRYHANNAYFMSYAPYNNPKISVTCLIPNGYASSNAVQTVRDVYKYYFSKDKKKVSGKVKMPENMNNHMD